MQYCVVCAGQNCDLIDSLCHSSPCQNNGTCAGTMTNYTCSCPFEWKGSNCETQVCVNCSSAIISLCLLILQKHSSCLILFQITMILQS